VGREEESRREAAQALAATERGGAEAARAVAREAERSAALQAELLRSRAGADQARADAAEARAAAAAMQVSVGRHVSPATLSPMPMFTGLL
jgi:hypothetical protein